MRCLPIACLVLLMSACAPPRKSPPELLVDQAIQNVKSGNDDDAIEKFQKALAIDPKDQTRLYLAITYVQLSGIMDIPEPYKLARLGMEQLDIVLTHDPNNVLALEYEGQALQFQGKFAEARTKWRSAQLLDQKDSNIPYAIGSLDWIEACKNANDVLHAEHLIDHQDGNIHKSISACRKLESENSALLEDAITNLQHSFWLNRDFEGSSSMLSLVYRRRADLHCADPAAIPSDLELARDWRARAEEAHAIKQKKLENLPSPAPPDNPLLVRPTMPSPDLSTLPK